MGKRAADAPKRSAGQPPFVPDREHLDYARSVIGSVQYPSRAAVRLVERFGFSTELAYRVIEQARREAIGELAGDGKDPMTGTYLFFESVMADPDQDTRSRLAAANGIARLLGLEKLLKTMGAGDVEAFLSKIAAAQAGRALPPA